METNKFLGIDIGGTAVKIGLVTEKGIVLAEQTYPVDFDEYETPILITVTKKAHEFLREYVSGADIKGIGVSATGQININTGVVEGAAGHIKNWLNSPIKDTLMQEFQVPVTVINDANSAALGEYWIGGAKGISDAVIVTIGTGIGGGIICNSQILLGENGSAGEVGHFTIQYDGEVCNCGNKGCYERYASTKALVKMVKKAIVAGELAFTEETVNGKTIFAELQKGNKDLEELYDAWMDMVTAGLVTLIHIFNPKKILIGGGISAQKEFFIDPLRKKVMETIMPMYKKCLTLEAASLGNDAGLVGAVYYCMTNLQEETKDLKKEA